MRNTGKERMKEGRKRNRGKERRKEGRKRK